MVKSSAFTKHPDHKIAIRPYQGLVEAWFNGRKIASTGQALEMSEADYPLVDCSKQKSPIWDSL